MVRHGPEQLPRLAGSAHNDALPVLVQKRFWHCGDPLEVFEIRRCDDLIEIFQAHPVPRQQDNVLGKAVGLAAQRPQFFHLGVDLLQSSHALSPQHSEEGDQHIAHRRAVIAGPVVVEGGQIQLLRHNVQLILVQLRQQVLGQNQRVNIGGLKRKTRFFAALPDKADVKFRVVGRQRASVHEF
ncbi:hypothetical protein SDC9_78049 [bioreactor metagenome]|uniref:Uncharacterized protein n=1 Tax=bioreactor metagenome TaxID=1076179 RepID=A0A644YZW7_9ZZZZ